MLKWLRQKPKGHHIRDDNQGSTQEVDQNRIITDDPLATIQVQHPQQKKSKNKSEEIYAVSRVNPLFEEDLDVPKIVVASRGNQSGSSGYESGSGSPSDDDESKYPQQRSGTDASSTSSTSSFSVLSRSPPKYGHGHSQLFKDEDSSVVHHQAAILNPEGKPVLHIVEQNPDFVQSIAVSVGAGDESQLMLKDAILNHSRSSTKVSVHPIPSRSLDSNNNVGVAKLIQKDNRYVQSIVIGGGSPEGKCSNVTRLVSTVPSPPILCKKPSVTFSERVELVADNANGKVLINSYRKQSNEQDSIVTDSLLLLTSGRPLSHDLVKISSNVANLNNENNSNNRLSHNHLSKSEGERKVSSSSSSGDENQKNEDLEAFSSSIRKNHPVKHIHSNSGKSLEINQAADHYSSSEYLDADRSSSSSSRDQLCQHLHKQHKNYSSGDDCSCAGCSEGQGISFDDIDETRSSSHEHEEAEKEEGKLSKCRRMRSSNGCSKSPFGGIADHYAIAKEIAKEIESYSNGAATAKANSKKSIVRDLLSGRGREALAFHTAIRKAAALNNNEQKAGSSSAKSGSNDATVIPFYPVSNEAINEWESVRIQQVYLKGRSWKEIDKPGVIYSSVSTSSSQEEDANQITGQRLLSAAQQGQVHSNKQEITTTHSQEFQQVLKSSIYGSDAQGTTSHDDTSSDSGNSTDRRSKGSREDLISDRRGTSTRSKTPSKSPSDTKKKDTSDEGNLGGGLSHSSDKVMIVTGDSQNMVVDLRNVPLDLREAIISGTALITFPDGLNGSSSKKGGYTIVSLPMTPPTKPKNQSSSNNNLKNKQAVKTTYSNPQQTTANKRLVQEKLENEILAAPSSSSVNLNLNVNQLERGELFDPIFRDYPYGSKNKSQIWDVMQHSVQKTLIESEKGKKKKRITTVLPFHPNQDVYKSPDFTMEGQRLERQKKKLDLAKKRRCVCRVFGIFFFLATFIGVLVALSMIYTKGQRYFGSV